MNNMYNLYSMDMDSCPENDAVIHKYTCSGCEYYKGFDLYYGQRCIQCSFYQQDTISVADVEKLAD